MINRIAVKQIDGKMWVTCEDFYYKGFTVPGGFWFDGASVPRVLWGFMNPSGKAFYPALLHDYLLEEQPVSRSHADWVFKQALKDYGVGRIRTRLAYMAVSVYGKIKKTFV